jgi:hypothetical protein
MRRQPFDATIGIAAIVLQIRRVATTGIQNATSFSAYRTIITQASQHISDTVDDV